MSTPPLTNMLGLVATQRLSSQDKSLEDPTTTMDGRGSKEDENSSFSPNLGVDIKRENRQTFASHNDSPEDVQELPLIHSRVKELQRKIPRE